MFNELIVQMVLIINTMQEWWSIWNGNHNAGLHGVTLHKCVRLQRLQETIVQSFTDQSVSVWVTAQPVKRAAHPKDKKQTKKKKHILSFTYNLVMEIL